VVALDSINYKTIASSVEFGGTFLFNGPDRAEFMRRYLDFLGYTTEPLSAVFSADETNICKGAIVCFEPLSNVQALSYEWNFEGGTPTNWIGPLPRIKYETPGIYSVSLSVNNGTNSNTFSLENLIRVDNCTGVEDTAKIRFIIYPNPATDLIVIEIREPSDREVKVTIADMKGQQLISLSSPGESNNIIIPSNSLKAGMYIVTVATDNWYASSKLIIK
jgi:PKD repeat protein